MTTTKIQKSTQFGIGITSGLGMASAVGHVGYKISSMTSEELLRLLLTMGISKDVGYMVINAARSLANKIPGGSKSITVVASLASGLAAGYLATKHSQSIADFSLEAKIAEVRKQIKHKWDRNEELEAQNRRLLDALDEPQAPGGDAIKIAPSQPAEDNGARKEREYQARIEQLAADNERLRTENTRTAEEKAELKKNNEALNLTIEKLNGENATLKVRVQSLETENSTLTVNVQTLQTDSKQANANIQQLQTEFAQAKIERENDRKFMESNG